MKSCKSAQQEEIAKALHATAIQFIPYNLLIQFPMQIPHDMMNISEASDFYHATHSLKEEAIDYIL